MKLFKSMLALALVAGLAGSAMAADKYVIDLVHSSVEFSVKHNMVSTVKGEFDTFSGEIMLDEKDLSNSSVMVTIETASINTGNDGRDKHLKSADFFDAANNVEITFKSTRVEKKGMGFVAHGMLTMRGVSKEVSLPFELNGPVNPGRGNLIGVSTALVINRKDYGISWHRVLDIGGVAVSDEVKIEINLEAGQAKG
jgi:polyisoprenoid-binding protein YceI